MYGGKQFVMTMAALAHDSASEQGWITIPVGAIVSLMDSPRGGGNPLVKVLWEGRTITIFSTDLTAYGTKITARSAIA